jgi:hypothetical protein
MWCGTIVWTFYFLVSENLAAGPRGQFGIKSCDNHWRDQPFTLDFRRYPAMLRTLHPLVNADPKQRSRKPFLWAATGIGLGVLALTSPLIVEPTLQIVENSWGEPTSALPPTAAVLGLVIILSSFVSLASLASKDSMWLG